MIGLRSDKKDEKISRLLPLKRGGGRGGVSPAIKRFTNIVIKKNIKNHFLARKLFLTLAWAEYSIVEETLTIAEHAFSENKIFGDFPDQDEYKILCLIYLRMPLLLIGNCVLSILAV